MSLDWLDLIEAVVEVSTDLVKEQKRKQGEAVAIPLRSVQVPGNNQSSGKTIHNHKVIIVDERQKTAAPERKPERQTKAPQKPSGLETMQPKSNKPTALNRKQLRQAVLYKEILDRPLSLR